MILAQLTREVRSVLDRPAKDPRIQRSVDLLRQTHAVQVDEIAASVNLSASGFRHLFKKALGVSPGHRLEHAKELLQNTFLTIKEITVLVGVNDVSHFVRDYKAFYRQTPSETRALFHKAPRRIPADSHYGQ